MPAKKTALELDKPRIEREPEQPQQKHPGPHVGDREGPLRLEDEEPDAVGARLHLADDHEDQCQRERGAHARKDSRAGRGQHHGEQLLKPWDPVDTCGLLQGGVDPAHAVDGVEQHRPHAPSRDDEDLELRSDAEREDRERDQHRRRYRTQKLDRRPGGPSHGAERTDQQTKDSAGHDRDGVPGEHSLQARYNVTRHPREQPVVAEAGEDVDQRREEEILRLRRPESPADENAGRHHQLQQQIANPPHAAASDLCDGCQRRARPSTVAKIELSDTPRRPATAMSAYMSGKSPPEAAMLIALPSPGTPTTSSEVTARISATEDARRSPVAL